MKNYESRLKKIQEILAPKRNVVVMILYGTDKPESWCEVNGQKFLIPAKVNHDEFLKDKLKSYSGIVTAVVYLSKDKDNNPILEQSNLGLKREDVLFRFTGLNKL